MSTDDTKPKEPLKEYVPQDGHGHLMRKLKYGDRLMIGDVMLEVTAVGINKIEVSLRGPLTTRIYPLKARQ